MEESPRAWENQSSGRRCETLVGCAGPTEHSGPSFPARRTNSLPNPQLEIKSERRARPRGWSLQGAERDISLSYGLEAMSPSR